MLYTTELLIWKRSVLPTFWIVMYFNLTFSMTLSTNSPLGLKDIITNEERRKKLIIYINPPCAEASNARTVTGTGSNRKGLACTSTKDKYKKELGRAGNEIFAQFFARIANDIPDCTLALFSTLKALQGPNFSGFRAKYKQSSVGCLSFQQTHSIM